MNRSIEQFVKIAESTFAMPDYTSYRVRYVENREEADVCVSKNHTLADYLVLGFCCLAKSVRKESGEIRVFNLTEEVTETVVVLEENHSRNVKMNSELFIQICEYVDCTCHALYQNSMEMLFFGFGLSVSTELMTHFSGVNTLPNEVMEQLKFTYFDDTVTAEKNAFFLIKKMYEASLAGYYYEVLKPE